MKVGNVGAFTVNLVYNELTGLTPHRQWKGGVAHYVFNSSRMHARISASVGSTLIPFDFRRSWAAACKSFLSATINAARRRWSYIQQNYPSQISFKQMKKNKWDEGNHQSGIFKYQWCSLQGLHSRLNFKVFPIKSPCPNRLSSIPYLLWLLVSMVKVH